MTTPVFIRKILSYFLLLHGVCALYYCGEEQHYTEADEVADDPDHNGDEYHEI